MGHIASAMGRTRATDLPYEAMPANVALLREEAAALIRAAIRDLRRREGLRKLAAEVDQMPIDWSAASVGLRSLCLLASGDAGQPPPDLRPTRYARTTLSSLNPRQVIGRSD